MKKITLLFALSFLIISSSRAQTITCSNFCVLSITIDTVGVNTLKVTVFNGDTLNINYPVVVVTNAAGDTVGNKDTAFFFFAQLAGDTVIHSIPTTLDSLGTAFTGTVYYRDGISHSTCSFAYPMNCTVGIKEVVAENNSLTTYPNPASNNVIVNLSNLNNQKVTINIFKYRMLISF